MFSKIDDWPDYYNPLKAGIFIQNEAQIEMAPNRVWAWLIRASSWSDWYLPITIKNHSGNDLCLGSRFSWTKFGFTLNSTVKEFTPNKLIGWENKFLGFKGSYERWYLEENSIGCRVIAEEVQKGIFPFLLSKPKLLFRAQQLMLKRLKEKSSAGKMPFNL